MSATSLHTTPSPDASAASLESDRPPAYATITHRASTASARSSPTEHTYHLLNSKKRAWATLRVQSRARYANHWPSFFQGEAISGQVDLNLEQIETVHAIDIEITGRLGSSEQDAVTFVEVSHRLWHKSMGNPRPSSGTTSSLPLPFAGSAAPHEGKLVGDFAWPFSLMLPSHVRLPIRTPTGVRTTEEFALPPSFHEKAGSRHSVQYYLALHVRRGKLRVDTRLGTVIEYTPVLAPAPASELRQLAYRLGSPLVDPEGDPMGWTTLEPFVITGTAFTTCPVEVICTLSLANPLSYTRGTAIPLILTLRSADAHALALLSAASAPVVRMLRHVSHAPAAAAKARSGRLDALGRSRASDSARGIPGVDFKVAARFVETAVWWPTVEGAEDAADGTRRLDGEIRLPLDLKPSCAIAHFELWYTIAVYPPEVAGFVPSGTDSLQTTIVTVASAYAPGPRPRALAPPGYNAGTRAPTEGLYHTRSALL